MKIEIQQHKYFYIILIFLIFSSCKESDPEEEAPDQEPYSEEYEEGVSPPEESMPFFQWPPPTASAIFVLQHFHQEQLSSHVNNLGDIDQILTQALDETGYYERSYYAVPDGFAVVTRLERIHNDGTPATNKRWSINDDRIQVLSFSQYLRSLFFADPGLFRVVVFLVTPHPFNQTDRQVSRDEAIEWLSEGFNILPLFVADKRFTREFNVTALVYQFEKKENQDPIIMRPSNMTGKKHLQAAGILEFLN